MTTYDFDAPVERHGTDCLKFDCAESRHRSPELLSLWVADMDFRTAPEILEAMKQRVDHGIFGYTEPQQPFFDAVTCWHADRYGWEPQREWAVVTPGVVFALAMAVRAFSQPGDCVLVQQPVYYPFTEVVEDNGRRVLNVPLVLAPDSSGYSIDFEAFEVAVQQHKPALFLLCNPHNPGGRVWTRAELERLASICLEHGVAMVSDEIHQDFARPGYEHCSLATLGPRVLEHSVICTSPSKTFNLAGTQVSNIFIPNPQLRTAFKRQVAAAGYSQANTLGLVACQAAYEHGGPWLTALKEYLEGNWALLKRHLAEHAPHLCLVESQSTYLAWIDCRALGLYGRELRQLVEDEAGLWLDLGSMFGKDGDGFIRINIATQRSYLQRALTQLTDAISKRV
ncbi:MAG: MalY/PatB family protein [Coriobacteriales bacterium]